MIFYLPNLLRINKFVISNKNQIVAKEGKITNKKYQELFDVSERTASRELNELVKKVVLRQVGITGKGTFYALVQTPHKRLTNASKEL